MQSAGVPFIVAISIAIALGVEYAIKHGMHPALAIILGIVSAVVYVGTHLWIRHRRNHSSNRPGGPR